MTAVLGRLIAQRRRDLGMSQRQLAERLCAETGRPTITRHELSRYERGIRLPNPTSLVMLAAVLDLPITNLTAARQRGDAAFHPQWCARGGSCTAYDPRDSSQAHRTEPVVIDTEDDGVKICLWVDATPDGSRLSIEISEVLGTTYRPFGGTAASAANGSSFIADLEVAGDIAEAITLLLKRVSGDHSHP
jgi:transcriptional regulator with XRE-family HTH domain